MTSGRIESIRNLAEDPNCCEGCAIDRESRLAAAVMELLQELEQLEEREKAAIDGR